MLQEYTRHDRVGVSSFCERIGLESNGFHEINMRYALRGHGGIRDMDVSRCFFEPFFVMAKRAGGGLGGGAVAGFLHRWLIAREPGWEDANDCARGDWPGR